MDRLNRRQFISAGATVAAVATLRPGPVGAGWPKPRRGFPPTARTIRVFNDQLSEHVTAAQLRFVARRYAGSQKQTRSFADRLRAINPGYLILHYRLALGAGPALFIRGDRWVTDWPFVNRQDGWFFLSPEDRRYHQDDWGWWLMDPDTPWRRYWVDQVSRECRLNDNDGVFADSCSVPSFLGAESFTPSFPPVDEPAERAWSRRIERFLRYARRRFDGAVYLIPNAGSWVTTRDTTDYSPADGVMIEGFAQWGPGSPFAESDWALQQDRILGLARRGRIVIHQSYLDDPGDLQSRMFVMASYLLVKGRYSYINLELGDFEPEWFPEYGLDLGAPLTRLPGRIDDLSDGRGYYERAYTRGRVFVNPGEGAAVIPLAAPGRLVVPVGGGHVPADGDVSAMRITTRRVTELRLGPYEGAVVLA